MDFSSCFGPLLLDNAGQKFDTNTLLQSKKFAMLLFSKSTCPPCQKLAPFLKTVYKTFKEDLEIIWVPADDPDEYRRYMPTQPWKTLPIESPHRYRLNTRTMTQGIPKLWLFSTETGKILSNDIGTILGNDISQWLSHAQRLESTNPYHWTQDLCHTVFDKNEKQISTQKILNDKKITLIVFLLPGNINFDQTLKNLHYIHEKFNEDIEIVWAPNNNIESYESMKETFPGYHYQFNDPQINKWIHLLQLQNVRLPAIYPVIHSTGEIKNNAIRKIMYADQTIKFVRTIERMSKMKNLHTFH